MRAVTTKAHRPNAVRKPTLHTDFGFILCATSVTTEAGIPVNILSKLASGQRPKVIDLMKNKDIAIFINTSSGKKHPRGRSEDPHSHSAKPQRCSVASLLRLLPVCLVSLVLSMSGRAEAEWPEDILGFEREHHTATLMPDGKVLVVGGISSIGYGCTGLFDPTALTWERCGDLNEDRRYHTANLLPDGKVLVTGGYRTGDLRSAEVFDPETKLWSKTGEMSFGRTHHTATAIGHRVLIVGGVSFIPGSPADVYDAKAGIMARSSSAPLCFEHTAIQLAQIGRVLVAGGKMTTEARDCYLYDATTDTWEQVKSLNIGRYDHQGVLMKDGRVFVCGGCSPDMHGGPVVLAEIYEPLTKTWRKTKPMLRPRFHHTVTCLRDGHILVVGGVSESTAEIYDPITETWADAGRLTETRCGHTATLLPNGEVMVLGGASSEKVEFYDPVKGVWRAVERR